MDLLQELLTEGKHPDLPALLDAAKEGDLEEFVELFDEIYGSSAMVWMDDKQRKELMEIIAHGGQVKSYSADTSNSADRRKLFTKANNWVDTHPGWEMLTHEENGSSTEIILVKR